MKNTKNLVVSKIVGVLFASTICVALTVGVLLYRSALANSEQSMMQLASSLANLIASVGEFDRRFSVDDDPDGAAGATLSQIRAALGDKVNLGKTGDVLLLERDGQDIQILVHKMTEPEGTDHTDLLPRGSAYHKAMLAGISKQIAVARVQDPYGHSVVITFAAIEGTTWTIAVERHLAEIQEPFVLASAIGGLLTIILALLGGFANYRTSMSLTKEAIASERLARNSQHQLEDLLDVISEGIALFDANDRLVLCNRVYKELYSMHAHSIQPGHTLEELLRAGLSVGAFPEGVGREDAWLKERLAQHRATETVEQKISDGRWLRISEKKTRDGGTIGVRTDITDLKNRELALRESEQRFKDFTDTASDWVWEADSENRFTYMSAGSRGNEEFNPDLVLTKTREEAASENTDTPKWIEHRRAITARKPFRSFRYWTVAPNGGQRFISVSGNPVFSESGEFRGYRGTVTDVTEEHLTIKRLHEAETLQREIFENATIALVHADSTGKIINFNAQAEKTFGYSAEEVIGANVAILMNDAERSQHDIYMNNYLRTGEAKIIGIGRELIAKHKNGTDIIINLGIAEVAVGNDRHFIASILDMTNERLLENKLRQSQKMEAVGQMVGGIAHDFNNLLGIINGNLDLMRREVEPESRLNLRLGKALGAVERGANLTRRLLNFSRQLPSEQAAIDVNATIAELHELIEKSLTKAIQVHLSLEEGLPYANADRGDFEDAITNICINARDAMPNGGQIIIETSVTQISEHETGAFQELTAGRYIEIDITDTGSGMSPEVASHIFEPFYSTKGQGKGTGLGLSMVFGFAKRSKGTVSVYSEQGLGTTFKLYLPVAAVDTRSGIERDADDSKGSDYSGSEKVLIVDDEADIADIAATILSELGYRTTVAHNGEDALEALRKDPEIDLLFTDVIMPGGFGGFELAEKGKRLLPNLQVCLASGFTGNSIHATGVDITKYPLLKKPYSNSTLARTVRQLLDERKA